ncbi:MAG: NFYB/HAP3 family transcription factor subunit [Candidatus Marsarchaeota archaeon]|nr:NFYB/HAP3 family transcription factor subunit [Candidatus Marsarchaeota archaeon]
MGERAFSLYDIEQFIREAGAERVTEDAVRDLERRLEKLTELMANRAARYAAHAGRSTLIKKQDVLFSKRIVYRNPPSLSPKPRSTKTTSSSDR